MTSPPTRNLGRSAPADPPWTPRARPPWRATLEAIAFVGLWVALGMGPIRDPLAYLLAGIPLTAAFQLAVRRRPLAELWIRAGGFRRPPATPWLILGAVLAAVPLRTAWEAVAARHWMAAVWAVAACGGAVIGSAVMLQRWAPSNRPTGRTWTRGLGAAIGAVSTGTAVVGMSALPTLADRTWDPMGALGVFAHSALLYLPAVFVLEEVTFRGCLDTHLLPVLRSGERPQRRRSVVTALVGSWLWGLWHLPLFAASGVPWPGLVAYLLIVHTLIGLPLTMAWRRSGSLVLPAAAHALLDGVRNALVAT